MNPIEQTLDATLDSNGQLTFLQQPQLPAGPVRVTIRVAPVGSRGLADVVREIAADQRSRGFAGRTASEVQAEQESCLEEDAERDRELEAARQGTTAGGP